MKQEKIYTVIGGDLRQIQAANYLSRKLSTAVRIYGFDEYPGACAGLKRCESLEEALEGCDFLILPLPISSDDTYLSTPFHKEKILLDTILSAIPFQATVLGGRVTPALRERFVSKGLSVEDYFAREELTILNAIPTAEGAIQIALEEMPITLHGSHCMVTGMGHVSKVLVPRLVAMGAKVTVAARKCADRAWARSMGCESCTISQMGETIGEMDVVFNSVPAMLFDEALLEKVPEETLLIDLASKPGGIDFQMASTMGRKTIWALSLPGKVAPITAGGMVA